MARNFNLETKLADVKYNLMRAIFYKFTFSVILLAGIIVGIVKGQEARQKWVSKKKIKYETKKTLPGSFDVDRSQVVLDEIEMSTYHS